jgi:hypothetical protein
MPALFTRHASCAASGRRAQAAAKARTDSRDDKSSDATSSRGAGDPAAAAAARKEAASSSPRAVLRHASTTARRRAGAASVRVLFQGTAEREAGTDASAWTHRARPCAPAPPQSPCRCRCTRACGSAARVSVVWQPHVCTARGGQRTGCAARRPPLRAARAPGGPRHDEDAPLHRVAQVVRPQAAQLAHVPALQRGAKRVGASVCMSCVCVCVCVAATRQRAVHSRAQRTQRRVHARGTSSAARTRVRQRRRVRTPHMRSALPSAKRRGAGRAMRRRADAPDAARRRRWSATCGAPSRAAGRRVHACVVVSECLAESPLNVRCFLF